MQNISEALNWNLLPHSPFFTFLVHFGYPLCGHAILLRYLQMTNESSLWTGALLQTGLAFDSRMQSLTASMRPLSVGDFSIRASNTSSVSFLTYNSTAERGGRINFICELQYSLYTCIWSIMSNTLTLSNLSKGLFLITVYWIHYYFIVFLDKTNNLKT